MTYAGLHNAAVFAAGSYSTWIPLLPGGKEALRAQEIQIKTWEERFTKEAVDTVITPQIRTKIWSPGDTTEYSQRIEQAKIFSQWATIYGEDKVKGILIPAIRNRLWTPGDRSQLFWQIYALDLQMQKFKYDFDSQTVDGIIPPSEQGKPFSKAERDQKRLQIFLIDLQKTLGGEAYRFLTEFLDLKGAEAAERLSELSSNHDELVQTVHLKFKENEASAKRDPLLWQRFESSQLFPFMGRAGLVVQLNSNLQRAKLFWDQVDRELSDVYSPKELQFVAKTYFSRFSEGHVSIQKENFAEFKLILERRKAAQEIAENCLPFLQLDSLESPHQPLKGKEILLKAVEAQIAFDTHLQKLRRLDLYCVQMERARAEKEFVKNLQKVPEDKRAEFVGNLSETDKQIVKSLEKRAAGDKEQFKSALSSMLNKLESYIEQIDENFLELNQELELDPANRMRACDSDLIDPHHFPVRSLLLLSRFLKEGDEKPVLAFVNEIQAKLQALQPGEPNFLTQALYFAKVQKEVLAGLKLEQPSSPPSPFFQEYQVFPIGDVLYNKDPNGKWAVFDLSGVAAEDRKSIAAWVKPSWLEKELQRTKPYQAIAYEWNQGTLVPNAKGSIKLFYEPGSKVIGAQENRDFGQRNRLSKKTWVQSLLETVGRRESAEDYERVLKDPKESRGRWNPGRQMTAAVDRLEGIWISRLIFSEVLAGRSIQIDANTYQHASEYLEALQGSDLASLQGSYNQDPSFNQAIHFFGTIAEPLIALTKERISVVYQEKDIQKRKYNLAEGMKLLFEIQNMYQTWIESIETFLAACKKDPKLRSDFNRFENEFRTVLPFLETFRDSFPVEIRNMASLSFDQIHANYTFEHLESLIKGSMRVLEKNFKALRLPLKNLSIIQASASLLGEITKKLRGQPQVIQDALKTSVSKSFQTPIRTETCLSTLAEAIAEPSPLHLQIKQVAEFTKQEINEASRLRAKETKKMLSRHGVEKAIEIFFPQKR